MTSWLDPYRWLLWGAFVIALLVGGYALVDHIGDVREAKVRAEYIKATKEENDKNAKITADLQKRKDDALEAANKRAVANKTAADGARLESDRLRNTLATVRGSLPTLTRDAVDKYADAASAVFDECQRQYSDLAAVADGISSDRQTLIDAWPK